MYAISLTEMAYTLPNVSFNNIETVQCFVVFFFFFNKTCFACTDYVTHVGNLVRGRGGVGCVCVWGGGVEFSWE